MALNILGVVRREDARATSALSSAFANNELAGPDRALLTELVYGVLRNRLYLTFILDHFATSPFKKVEPKVADILMLGAYQILMLDRIPDHAAINESVRLAPQRARGFVNALLRKISNQQGNLPEPDGEDALNRISICTSHPKWMVEIFAQRFGIEGAQSLCEANQTAPQNVIRVNRRIIDRRTLIEKLRKLGVDAKPTEFAKDGIVVDRLEKLLNRERYKQGRYIIQGQASQLVVELLDPQPGEKILDTCAAPGGKATHISVRVGDEGTVFAVDINRGRLTRIKENAMLIGTNNIQVLQADMTRKPPSRLGTSFDRVLVDAPCSGLGDLGKNPDSRYVKQPDAIPQLVRIQRALIQRAADLVTPGGVLVYSTCSLSFDENEGVVEPFLNAHPEFKLEPADMALGQERETLVNDAGYFVAVPHQHKMGGFFAARMRKMNIT